MGTDPIFQAVAGTLIAFVIYHGCTWSFRRYLLCETDNAMRWLAVSLFFAFVGFVIVYFVWYSATH